MRDFRIDFVQTTHFRRKQHTIIGDKYLSAFALCIVQNLHLHLVEIPDLFSLLSVKLYHHFTLFSTFCCGQIRRSYGEKSAKIGQVVKTLRQAEEDEWKER